jgi:hypothetical protein
MPSLSSEDALTLVCWRKSGETKMREPLLSALRSGAVRDFIRNLQFLRWQNACAASRKHLAAQNVSLALF